MKPVVGTVVSNKMQKSVVVAVDRLFHHKMFNRYVKRTSKFMGHDEQDQCIIGDRYYPDVCKGSNCGVQFSRINEAYDSSGLVEPSKLDLRVECTFSKLRMWKTQLVRCLAG